MTLSSKELSRRPLAYYKDGAPAAVLGLSMEFYFGSPGKRERRLALIDAIEQYCQQAQGQLVQYYIDGDKQFRQIKKDELPEASLLQSMVDDKPDFQFNTGSGINGVASCWSSIALAEKVMRANYLGYLLLTYPVVILEQIGMESFIRQFATLCNALNVEHAYAGYSAIFPSDVGSRNAACEVIGNVLMAYPGLDAYSLNTTSSNCENGIKSVNFLTAVSHRLLEKAGGTQAVLANLDSQVWQCEYNNGIIFQAGQQPELGSPDQLPPAYVALGKALKPVRADFNKTLFYDPKGEDNKAFTQRWLSRFDG